jgi:hypothetical protein
MTRRSSTRGLPGLPRGRCGSIAAQASSDSQNKHAITPPSLDKPNQRVVSPNKAIDCIGSLPRASMPRSAPSAPIQLVRQGNLVAAQAVSMTFQTDRRPVRVALGSHLVTGQKHLLCMPLCSPPNKSKSATLSNSASSATPVVHLQNPILARTYSFNPCVTASSKPRALAACHTALAAGHSIAVRWMKGRSRAYSFSGSFWRTTSTLTIAFNDRCDAIVATAIAGHNRPAELEPVVLDFLNGDTVILGRANAWTLGTPIVPSAGRSA